MRVAAVNWKVRAIRRDRDFYDRVGETVGRCRDLGAELIVFPELIVLELLGASNPWNVNSVPQDLSLAAPDYEEVLRELARRHGTTIVGGSHFRSNARGIANVTMTVAPSGEATFQEKVKLTTYERETWNLASGSGLTPCDNPLIGVTICYDAEFPESGRKLAESGALIQCVPAYAEARFGFQRVRWSCHARAIENQIYVIHASLVGSLGGEPVPTTYGSSAVISPSIEPFPESAILAETGFGEDGIAVADLDVDLVLKAREQGDVRNWHDRLPKW